MSIGRKIMSYKKHIMKPVVGFEPTALALQERCSTTELHRHIVHKTSVIYHTCQYDKSSHQLIPDTTSQAVSLLA